MADQTPEPWTQGGDDPHIEEIGHCNEIAALNPRLGHVDCGELMYSYFDRCFAMWKDVFEPFLDECPYVMQRLDYRSYQQVWEFVLKNNVGLQKLGIQVEIDQVKRQLEQAS